MRFIVDAQLPPALARWLESRGHETLHVADIGLLDAPDSAIWQYAREGGLVILTKDEDFAIWRNTADKPLPRVVWLRVGNTRKQDLLRWFDSLLPRVLSALEAGESLVEVT